MVLSMQVDERVGIDMLVDVLGLTCVASSWMFMSMCISWSWCRRGIHRSGVDVASASWDVNGVIC